LLDVSDKIAAFFKKLLLWKEDIANVSGSSQCFTCLICLKIHVWCCLQTYEVYFCNIHLS